MYSNFSKNSDSPYLEILLKQINKISRVGIYSPVS